MGALEPKGTFRGPVLLPRLTLAAFCRTQQVMEGLREACAHPWMQPVRSEVASGGIDGAIQSLQGLVSALDVIVVEVEGTQSAVMADLERLAQVCSGRTRVFVIGHSNDVKLYQRVIREGACDYLLAPLVPLEFIESLAHALAESTGSETPGAAALVLGARGGAGATTVACNLAFLLAERFGFDTALADLNFPFGAAASHFDIVANAEHAHYLYTPELMDAAILDQILVPRGARLKILAAAPNLTLRAGRDALVSHEKIIALLRASHRVTVCDMPLVWGRPLDAELARATDVVLVVPPDFSGAQNAQTLIAHLDTLRGAERRALVVLNQMRAPQRRELTREEIAHILGYAPSDLFVIGHDARAFSTSEQEGKVLSERVPSHPAVATFASLCARLSGLPVPRAPVGLRSHMRQILRRLSGT
jgi:pilus assembly protein CpaE